MAAPLRPRSWPPRCSRPTATPAWRWPDRRAGRPCRPSIPPGRWSGCGASPASIPGTSWPTALPAQARRLSSSPSGDPIWCTGRSPWRPARRPKRSRSSRSPVPSCWSVAAPTGPGPPVRTRRRSSPGGGRARTATPTSSSASPTPDMGSGSWYPTSPGPRSRCRRPKVPPTRSRPPRPGRRCSPSWPASGNERTRRVVSARAQAARGGVREDVDDLAAAYAVLHPLPEVDLVQVAVGPVQRRAELGRQGEEAGELLGEHVAGADAEPGLVGVLVLVPAGHGQRPEAEVGEQRQLVVVVADDAAVARDAEVLGQQLAGENAAGGQVLDGLPEIDHRRPRLVRRRRPHVEVERVDPALDVGVVDDDLVAVEGHRAVGVSLELQQQLGPEPAPVELQVLELLRLDQPAGSVVVEDQPVVLDHALGRDRLDERELVPDQLEDQVVAGHGEDDHHETRGPRRQLEAL